MKLDMDLCRAILLEVERQPSGFAPDEVVIEGFDDRAIGYNIYMLGEAGFLKVGEAMHMQSESLSAKALHLTFEGHQFLEKSRSLSRWNRAKKIIAREGTAALFEAWGKVLTDLIMKGLG